MITLSRIPVKVRDDRFRREFRDLRRAAGLRQTDVAEGIGVTAPALSRWERGEPSMGAARVRQAVEWIKSHREART